MNEDAANPVEICAKKFGETDKQEGSEKYDKRNRGRHFVRT